MTQPSPVAADGTARALERSWWLLILAGLLGVVAGIIVLAEPSIALGTLAVITGIFLLADGLFETAAAAVGAVENRGVAALLGVVSAIAGVILVRHPIAGVVAVALLLGLWLITLGVLRLVRTAAEGGPWLWSGLVAAVELVAGIVIVSSPHIGVRTLAVLVGISFVVRGVVMCALGGLARTWSRPTGTERGRRPGVAPGP